MQEMMLAAAISDNSKYVTSALYEIISVPFSWLKTRFDLLIKRHEILRTTLMIHDGKLMMNISDSACAEIINVDILPEIKFTVDPLNDKILIRIYVCENKLLFAFSHILLDGFSVALIMNELLSDNLPQGTPPPFRYYLKWLSSKEKIFENFDDFEQVSLPFYRETTEYERGEFSFEFLNSAQIKDSAKQLGMPTGRFIEAVWGILCARYSGGETFIATVDSGRFAPIPSITKIVGMFISTLSFAVNFTSDTLFCDFAKEFAKTASLKLKQAYNPLSVKLNSIISIEFAELSQNRNFRLISSNAKLVTDFDFVVRLGDEITFCFEYNKRAFSDYAVAKIRDHFVKILTILIENPRANISQIDFLSEDEKDFLFRPSEDNELLASSLIPITEKFDTIARKYPQKAAIFDSEKSYNYSEIKNLSDNIARFLIANNFCGGVMIKMSRSAKIIVAEIGIMKAGCYFIPVSVDLPELKLCEIIKTVSPALIITEDNYDIYSAYNGDFDLPKISYDMISYAIMTSGTTGDPKGVLINHRAISHYLAWAARTYQTDENTASALIYGFTFDGAFGSVYNPLLSGGTVYILDDKTRFDIVKIADYCSHNHITHIDLPASMLLLFTDYLSKNTVNSQLKFIITGGEQVTKFTDCGVPVSNEYGPTECTVCVTQTFLFADKKIHIGNEIPNTKIYVLDPLKNICPIGVFGECYVAGISVSNGYIGDNENFAFSQNIFGDGKMYKTGDRVRYVENNGSFVLEFAGREDAQIKLNGFRIELGEIQNAANKYCGILSSAATIYDNILLLYAVCDDTETVREKLREVLPHYMVPTVISVPEIPLKESGKPDFNKLKKSKPTSSEFIDISESPYSQIICDLIFSIIGIRARGTDNFTSIGGNSISAMKISFALAERGITLSPADIITSKSISDTVRKMGKNSQNSEKLTEFNPPNSLKSMIYLSKKYDKKIFAVSASVKCEISREILAKRIEKSAEMHDILRCSFYIDNEQNINAKIIDTPNIRLISENAELPETIAPLGETLIFVQVCDGVLSLRYHHIVLDGFSVNLLLSELSKGLFPNEAASFASFAASFSESKEDSDYYEKSLNKCDTITLFESVNAPDKLTLTRYFEEGFFSEIEKAARETNVTPVVFIMAALGVFLGAFGETDNVIIPTVASFRNCGGLMGCAAQTFPVAFLKIGNSFAKTAIQLQDTLSETTKHINIPEKYLKLPFIFVDEDRFTELTESQNYGLVITSGGAILYDEKSVSENLINTIKTMLKASLDNALQGKISVYKNGEIETLTKKFPIGKKYINDCNYLGRINNPQAFQIKSILEQQGIGIRDLVAILENRTNEALFSYAAVSLTGAAVLPIDSDLPEERITEIITDCCPSAIIKNGKVTFLENGRFYDPNTAYVIYTSGSTGKPKGVPISRGALESQISFTINEFGFSNEDTIMHFVNFAFDPSIWIIYAGFSSGANIEVVPENIRISPDLVAKFITDKRITIAVLPAAAAYDILSNLGENCLRYIFLGGDKIHIPKRNKFTDNIEIINLYGPTEACINATFYRLQKTIENTACIGKPVSNTEIYILNKDKNPSPIGIRGEIYIGGDKLSSGYINRPVETENAFLTLPEFGRVYKTGDIAAWNCDGTIEFFGRCDRQIKIRGFRVELSEIEAVIFDITNAPSAVKYENGTLTGFTESVIPESEISERLREKLPAYMVPSRIINAQKLPQNQNGKIDYKSLKIPDVIADNKEMTDTEKIIAAAFENVLSLPAGTVGRESDFFALGGHSLKLFSLTGTLAAKGICPGINDILKNPIVSKLAEIADKTDGTFTEKISLASDFDEAVYNNFTERCKKIIIRKKRTAKNIMITGATGFLGAHLLGEVLHNTSAKIYLPVRGEISRIEETLHYYFPGESFDFSRLRVFSHDISEKSPVLNEKIDLIYHSAADIRHYAPYNEAYRANVTATENIIHFALQNDAYLAHISTASAVNCPVITEMSFDVGVDFENVYQKTKQAAERLVLGTENLRFGIYRVGNVTPSLRHRIHAKNSETNAYLTLLRLLIKSRTLPDFRGRSGYCFADETARAICLIAECEINSQKIFHITNSNILTFAKIFDMINISENTNNDNIPDELRGIFAQRAVEKKTDSSAEIKNAATLALLCRLGFEWTAPDTDYLREYIDEH
jgi:amino acid adenylation domain-containing protein